MKTATSTLKSGFAIVLCAVAALVLSLAFAPPAAAWIDHGGWGGGWGYDDGYYDDNWDESQAWAEEQAREADRKERRKEVAAEQEQKSAETQAYYAELYAASSASLTAPKGVFYRKPGWTSSDPPPPSAQTVTATLPEGPQISLIYDQGIFWYSRGSDYVVAIPPPGVAVDKLPPGIRAITTKQGTFIYFFGVFFQKKGDKYAVVRPPAGLVVGYLPDGYTQEESKAGKIFKFGGITYKQVFVQGVLAYQVA